MWDKPQGDRLTKLILRYQEVDNNETDLHNVTSLELKVKRYSYVLENLKEDTIYMFNLSMVNAAGESSPLNLKLKTGKSLPLYVTEADSKA